MAFIMSSHEDRNGDRADDAPGRLAGSRSELHWCFGMRRDALFDVCDAVLCKQERA